MEINEPLLSWLKNQNLLTQNPFTQNAKLFLHEDDVKFFETGQALVAILQRLSPSTPTPSILSLKSANSAAAKLYNWNLLIKALEPFSIHVDSDMKALIISGDRQVIFSILMSLYKYDKQRSTSQSLSISKNNVKSLLGEGTLLLDELNTESPLSSSESTLEFLVLSLCKSFSLSSKLSAGLLMQSGKFLSQVLKKGLKGKSEPVLAFYETVISNQEKLAELINKEKNSLSFVLNSVKGGIESNDAKVVEKTCKALVLVCKDADLEPLFLSEILEKALAAYDLFKDEVAWSLLELIVLLGKNNLKETFGQMIIRLYPEPLDSFRVISSLWTSISEDSQPYKDLHAQGLIAFWVETGLRQAQNAQNLNNKVGVLGFLLDTWMKFYSFIAENDDLANGILGVVLKACREKSRIVKIICFGRLFLLLSLLYARKNSFALIVYKNLTFAVTENFANERIREFLLYNFLAIFEEIPSLPLSSLIEPYVKLTHSSQKKLNSADFDFFLALASHPRLSVKDAVILSDNLGQVYFNDFLYSTSAEIPLILLFGRFIEARPVQELIVKLIQIGFRMICSRLKENFKPGDLAAKVDQVAEKYIKIIKKLLCRLTEKIVNFGKVELNREIREIFTSGFVEIKKQSSPVTGLKVILDLIGRLERNKSEIFAVSEIGESRVSNRIVSLGTSSNKKRTVNARTRALSEIERVRNNRIAKEEHEKNLDEKRKTEFERQKVYLKSQLEQRKILLAKSESADSLLVKEAKTLIFQFYPIDEETEPDQNAIFTAIRRYRKLLKSLFNNYSSSCYKSEKVLKSGFDEKKEKHISEGEVVKLLRDHSINNSMISTEEVLKLISWMMQKIEPKKLKFDKFSLLIFYISQFIFTRSPFEYSQFPPVICFLVFIDYLKKSTYQVIPNSCYTEPDYGVGDRDILKILNNQLNSGKIIDLPEGYKKAKEKDLKIEFAVPLELNLKESLKICVEIFDKILQDALRVRFLRPVVSVFEVDLIKGFLNKPKVAKKEDFNEAKVPRNKASYKVLPLPAYMSFSPSIKLEFTRLAERYPNDLLNDCARLLDDLLLTVQNKSAFILSKNPRRAGSISNKIIQRKIIEEEFSSAEKQRQNFKLKLRKESLNLELTRLRTEQKTKEIEEKGKNLQEKEKQGHENQLKLEKRKKLKEETEKKIKEFRLIKEQEELLKLNKENEISQKIKEKKKREREEFLKQAKKQMIEKFNKMKDQNSWEKNQKKEIRKNYFKKMGKNKENLKKIEISEFMGNDRVLAVFRFYEKSLKSVFSDFCKIYMGSSLGNSVLALNGFSKLTSGLKISPELVPSGEAIGIFKRKIKNKLGENGIDYEEFKEVLGSLAISARSKLEDKLGRKFEDYSEYLEEFFKSIGFSEDPKRVKT